MNLDMSQNNGNVHDVMENHSFNYFFLSNNEFCFFCCCFFKILCSFPIFRSAQVQT